MCQKSKILPRIIAVFVQIQQTRDSATNSSCCTIVYSCRLNRIFMYLYTRDYSIRRLCLILHVLLFANACAQFTLSSFVFCVVKRSRHSAPIEHHPAHDDDEARTVSKRFVHVVDDDCAEYTYGAAHAYNSGSLGSVSVIQCVYAPHSLKVNNAHLL